MKKMLMLVIFFVCACFLFSSAKDASAFSTVNYTGSMTKGGHTYTDFFVKRQLNNQLYEIVLYDIAFCAVTHLKNSYGQFRPGAYPYNCSPVYYIVGYNQDGSSPGYAGELGIDAYANGAFWQPTGTYWALADESQDVDGLGTSQNVYSQTDDSLLIGNTLPLLTVTLDPAAGGTVASSPTGDFSCTNGTCSGHFSGDVTLTANPSSGYAFAYWGWNNGGSSSTVNPVTISVTSNDTVTAKFVPVLQFPLLGTLANRKLTHFYWDDTWTLGQCPTGTYKKHAGVDLSATYGESVNAAHAGTVKIIFTGQHSEWADAIVIESSDGQFTTVYWHVTKYGTLAVNDTVIKGQQIATVADLSSNTHFHFGIRLAPYSDPESYAGALPVADGCGYLAFPEKFIDPEIAIYE